MADILDIISSKGALTPINVGQYALFSGKGMRFHLEAFDFEGLCHVSVLKASGFLGLMKMDTLIFTPYGVDLPIFSYDGIKVAGKRTELMEFCDSLLGSADQAIAGQNVANLSSQIAVRQKYDDLPDKPHDWGWETPFILAPSGMKTGRGQRPAEFAAEMIAAYLDLIPGAAPCDPDAKRRRSSDYVEGLISNGGPAIGVMRQIWGDEATEDLFRRFIFGTLRESLA